MVRLLALILTLLLAPCFLLFYILVKITSKGPFLFIQKRAGKDKKPFFMYKIRTMIDNAEKLKMNYRTLNEADGPVFKIRNDPRYTRVGKWLSHTGLDELPQLINVIRGEMAFVGPRPLPLSEADKIPKKYSIRFSIAPGITSPWVIKGAHKLSFQQWMTLDCEYVKNRSYKQDLVIAGKTVIVILESIL